MLYKLEGTQFRNEHVGYNITATVFPGQSVLHHALHITADKWGTLEAIVFLRGMNAHEVGYFAITRSIPEKNIYEYEKNSSEKYNYMVATFKHPDTHEYKRIIIQETLLSFRANIADLLSHTRMESVIEESLINFMVRSLNIQHALDFILGGEIHYFYKGALTKEWVHYNAMPEPKDILENFGVFRVRIQSHKHADNITRALKRLHGEKL